MSITSCYGPASIFTVRLLVTVLLDISKIERESKSVLLQIAALHAAGTPAVSVCTDSLASKLKCTMWHVFG